MAVLVLQVMPPLVRGKQAQTLHVEVEISAAESQWSVVRYKRLEKGKPADPASFSWDAGMAWKESRDAQGCKHHMTCWAEFKVRLDHIRKVHKMSKT